MGGSVKSGVPGSATEKVSLSGAQVVIGTAGHVDHGKSTLVRALTGIDPDRLQEEKDRQMTIDLGFAWIELPGGRRAGIIDVPGHERFIKNMLAGVGGVDLALLVIAADEGPMPQTREHLAILDLLGVTQGIVALTKTDMVDGEMIDLVTEETGDLLDGTGLAGAPIVAVSAVTGAGLDDLVTTIDSAVSGAKNAHQIGPPRLPIDRVFSIQGFGTVVTGTVIGGPLHVGQDVVLMPQGTPARIRGIQSHNQKIVRVEMGSRAAINLAGLAVEEIERGDVLTIPGGLVASARIDCRVTMLPSAPGPLEQNDSVDFFCGSAEMPAWPTLLESEAIPPGNEGWVQFRLSSPVAVAKGDRFIIRRPSPSETIGGGVVVDAHPVRHKRFRPEVISTLEVLETGAPAELVYEVLRRNPVERRALLAQPPAGLDDNATLAALTGLIERGEVVALDSRGGAVKPGTFVVAAERWTEVSRDVESLIDAYHRANPLRRGVQREELRRRLGYEQRPFDAIIAAAAGGGAIVDDGAIVRLPGFSIVLDPGSQNLADVYLRALEANPMSPPAPGDFDVDDLLLNALAELGRVVKVADSIAFAPAAYREMTDRVMTYLDEHGSITLATFRDLFGTSRKFAQAVLEHFDQERLTRRVGDERRRF